MLRELLVYSVIAVGLAYSFRSPFYLLLLYLWTAYFRPDEWMWGGLPFDLSFVMGCLVAVAIFWSPTYRRVVPRMGLLVLFFLDALLSTVVANTPPWSWHYFQEFARVIFITYAIATLVTDGRRLRAVLMVIALSLGFEAAKQGWIKLFVNPGVPNLNTHPALGDNNGIAMGMMMLLPIFAVLIQTARGRWEKHMHRFLLGGALLRGLTTYSRGGFLAGGAVAVLQIARAKQRLRVLVVVVLVGALTVSVLPSSFWARMSTIAATQSEQDQSERGRIHFWATALLMAAARPLTGVGLNGFQTAYDTYDDSRGLFGTARAVHSTWFGVLADLGIPGLLLFLLITLSTFVACERIRRRARFDPRLADLAPYAVAIETSLAAFVVAGTFLGAQYNELFWHLVGCSIALQSLAIAAAPATPRWALVPRQAAPGGLMPQQAAR
ncbi:MAG TPA: putative O-glycosylation ligase, exosortase A system-associated [Vicinamibacterales bacterium]|nr:putative O-glycosylation ligase, exosortase A system-associated [Vicinamibacterales bacterium]